MKEYKSEKYMQIERREVHHPPIFLKYTEMLNQETR